MENNKFQYELDIQKFWDEKQIFKKVNSNLKGSKKYVWVEGPPYPTGDAHLGHLRNWAIKDSVLRFKRLTNHDVYTKDGYDVHGLPVEQKVQKKLGIKDTKELKESFGVDNFIEECRKYVSEIINDMKGVRKRYGFWLDTNHWQTSHPQYISMGWQFFKKAHEKDLLYKDYKCVAWSPALETTLSDYEVKDSYAELEDPSIYVRFKLEESTSTYDEYLLIWTTTPWTLEANLAIAINRNFDYAKVLIQDDNEEYIIIVGEPLVEQVIPTLKKSQNIKSYEVISVVNGSELENKKYEHIYPENPTQKNFKLKTKYHRVVHADFVSLGEGESHLEKLEKKSFKHEGPAKTEEKTKQKKVVKDGTGLAHEAPAHGMEDFELCRSLGMDESYCVVDEKGLMIEESQWKGMNFRDANEPIIKYLVDKKIILHSELRKHTYPLCWRSKVPIVYRTTDQWYIKRGSYTDDIIKANSNVNWFPNSAKTSFNNLIEGAGDWAISRQRFWGTPMPIFIDEEGNYDVFGSKEELEKKVGQTVPDLHLDNLAKLSYTNPNSNLPMKHVGLTIDVWFDSGCASFASHYGEGLSFKEILDKYYPMSLATEGEDQIRGWFSSLFNVGFVASDGKAPYNNVLFQGFVMAKDGQKMSKSLGNGITGNESIERYGADATRYYLLTKNTPEAKLNFDMDEFEIVFGFFNTLENIFKYCNSYLEQFEVKIPTLTLNSLDAIDLWILYKLNKTLESFNHHMENFKMNLALKDVENFIVNDLSKVYLKLIKDRTESRDENLILVLNDVLKKSLVMLSVAIPFKAEELYQNSQILSKKESIFLEELATPDGVLMKKVKSLKLEENFDIAQDIIGAVLNSREKSKIGIRWPLGQVDIISTQDLSKELEVFEPLIKKLTNISKINYDIGEDVSINYIIKPNFVSLKQDFKNPSDAIKAINMSKHYIANDIKSGLSHGEYEGVNIDFEKHIIKEIELKGDFVSSDFTGGNIILHTHQDEILLEEGYLRELFRRVQDMRKDLGLNKSDEIKLSFDGSTQYYKDLVENCQQTIKKKVGATEILKYKLRNEKEFGIRNESLVVSLER